MERRFAGPDSYPGHEEEIIRLRAEIAALEARLRKPSGFSWLPCEGEMADRIRAFDWSGSPLGPPNTWPQSLRTALTTCLSSKYPMYVWWGPEFVNLYNDAYIPLAGALKHPRCLGRPAREMWPEIWDAILVGFIAQVRETKQAVWHEDFPMPLERAGKPEEGHFTFSFNPAFDEAGDVAGILCTCHETTSRLRAERDLRHAHARAESAYSDLRAFFMQNPSPMVILLGPEHRFSLANAPYERLVGRDVLGKTVREAFTPDEIGHLLPELDRVFRTGAPYIGKELSFRIPDAEGRLQSLWIDIGYHPLLDPDGRIQGVMAVVHDVTEQVEARLRVEASEAALRDARDRLDLALRSARLGAWRIEYPLKVLHGDELFRTFHDTRPTEEVESAIDRLGHPEDRPRVRDGLRNAVLNGVTYECEYRVRQADGSYTWIYARGEPRFNEDGKIEFISGVAMDIDGRKRMELELAHAKAETDAVRERLSLLITNAPAFVCALRGPEHVFDMANAAYQRLVGVGRPLLGRSVRDALPETVGQGFIELLDGVFDSGREFVGIETPVMLSRNAGATPVEAFVNFIYQPRRDALKRVEGIDVFGYEVTEQVRARRVLEENEALFRQISDTLPLMIWLADVEGLVFWSNRWWYSYTGYGHLAWAGPDSPVHPDDVGDVIARWRECVSTGSPFRTEMRIWSVSARTHRWHLCQAVPLRDEAGTILKWVGSSVEVHDQKKLVVDLEIERDLRERFVAALSHDLRTPLAAAKLGAQLLGRSGLDPHDAGRTAVRIAHNIDRADGMIRDLLDVGRIKAGEEVMLEIDECDLDEVLVSTVDDLTSVYGDRFRFVSGSPGAGHWDGDALRRVVENLASNAIKYGERSSRVTIRSRRCDEEVEIAVHNEGEPIPDEQRAGLFEPYRRSDSALKGNQKGWGIGLMLVRGFTEAHGGRVEIESSRERGTTFLIRLPRDSRPTAGGMNTEAHPRRDQGG